MSAQICKYTKSHKLYTLNGLILWSKNLYLNKDVFKNRPNIFNFFFLNKARGLRDQAEFILITSSPTTSYVVFSKFLYHSGPQ